ncbi:ADP-ribosylglycohydrolase family protein [Pedobacter puniceum]|uniref:ADP-ribosylglycohydrolase family protein n=1 Tax=Pedobacter puniceum TaxID=2666136 RepID=A0A7K0FT22_9SPHI|nr:ADP-ribosylglycohydrolase family protein [Pedobacter puniceum]MRX48791.1 hypothetical protein [Pedobacter puniceum]
MTQLTYDKYYDKVLGGWVGKCAGGILGAPIEGFKHFNDIEISDKLFETNFANDDLDLQVLWLDMVMKKSVHINEKDFAEHWKNFVGFPWNEYGIATRNLNIGIIPPESGRLNNYYWKSSMGCPIRSELWGMLCPGIPEKAAYYAGLDGSLDHSGFSVEAEQYFSVCASIAFFETDIMQVLRKALGYIPKDGSMYALVIKVLDWCSQHDAEKVMYKIKSFYGDADFTSAPMNIAFTILTLATSNTDFNCIAQALHMGHDSDCIVATAGALIGIIKGYENIPTLWKERVGEEILISEAIIDIYKPATIFELTAATCKEGMKFCQYFDHDAISDNHTVLNIPHPPYQVKVEFPLWDDSYFVPHQIIRIYFTDKQNSSKLSFSLKDDQGKLINKIDKLKTDSDDFIIDFEVNLPTPTSYKNAFRYQLLIAQDDVQLHEIAVNMPYYGSWALLGPFIEDDKKLIPCDETYPEHGMSSMPSTIYMNHDQVNIQKDFIKVNTIKELLADRAAQPFHIDTIHASSFNISVDKFFYGKGEKTLFLYSNLTFSSAIKLWVCMGCTSYLTVFVNGKEVYKSLEIKRCWPAAHVFLQEFNEGENEICIRLDTLTDETRIEFGLKDFKGEHHHQSQWSTIVPFLNY